MSQRRKQNENDSSFDVHEHFEDFDFEPEHDEGIENLKGPKYQREVGINGYDDNEKLDFREFVQLEKEIGQFFANSLVDQFFPHFPVFQKRQNELEAIFHCFLIG